MLTGLIIITGSPFAFANLNPSTSFTYITILYGVRMFGLSMVMMLVATARLNQLSKRLIPHGAAMDNTMKMIVASVGIAILVTVMIRTAETAQQRPEIAHPDMYGANVAFIVIAILSLLGVIISFCIKERSNLSEKKLKKKQERNISLYLSYFENVKKPLL